MIFPGDKICDTANANANANTRRGGSQYPEWTKSLRLKKLYFLIWQLFINSSNFDYSISGFELGTM